MPGRRLKVHEDLMSASPPLIFDRALARARLRKALERGAPDFLMQRAAEDTRGPPRGDPPRFSAGARFGNTDRTFRAAARRWRTPGAAARGGDFAPGETGARLAADEEALPFAPEAFDLIVSGLALQWVNDLPGVFAQIRRCLAPDGLFLACLVGGASLTGLRGALAQAEDEILGGASPRVSQLVDVRDLGGLLQRAGFALPVTDADAFTLRYDSMFALCDELRAMGAARRADRPLAQAIGPTRFFSRGANLRRAVFRPRRTRARQLRNRLALRLAPTKASKSRQNPARRRCGWRTR